MVSIVFAVVLKMEKAIWDGERERERERYLRSAIKSILWHGMAMAGSKAVPIDLRAPSRDATEIHINVWQ